MSDTSTAPEEHAETANGTAAETAPEVGTVVPEATTESTPDVVEAAPTEASEVPASEPEVMEPVVAGPAVVEPVVVAPADAQSQVVYVEAPKPFVKKGNRGFGVLIALLSTVIFAAAYAIALVLVELVRVHSGDIAAVLTSNFWATVALFAIGFIVLALIANRAGWAAHVFGSLFVGLFVYFGSAGAVLVIHASEIPSNAVGAQYQLSLFSVGAILAALIARETALWMGLAIAARGRKVKARNIEARKLYDEEIQAQRAEYEAGRVPVA